jgi:hypothetical protein
VLVTRTRKAVYAMGWKEFRKLFLAKYVPHHEIEKLENEYLHLQMEGTDYMKYTSRFLELVGLIPEFVGSEAKRIGHYIWGLVPEIRADVCTSKPATL